VDLDGEHAVVVAQPVGRAEVSRDELREALRTVRNTLRPQSGRLLIGLRDEEVVAIFTFADGEDFRTLRTQADAAASALPAFIVAAGRRHKAAAGISSSYTEAQEAALVGQDASAGGRLYAFSDTLLRHVLRTRRYGNDLIAETIEPLLAYDSARRAALVRTLSVYVDTRFNLTRTADQLHVHPNTVGYRLRRMGELTGHDPAEPEGLMLLALGLKLHTAGS
jgi:DNA-binding PucR family transcriptional regulator